MEQGLVLKKKYTLQEKIGSGTFSDVWLASTGNKKNKKVAIKVILPIKEYYYYDARDYEKKLLEHVKEKQVTGVVEMLDSFTFYLEKQGEKERYFAIVFSLQGMSMYQFQKKLKEANTNNHSNGGLPLVLFQKVAREFIETLRDLHEKANVIHTDLKPENLCFSIDNDSLDLQKRTVLIDFGSAVREGKDHKGGIISTRQYRAPEVILGNGWSYPADIWSYGCILFELLTGNLLFQTHNSLEHLNLMEIKLQTRIQTLPRKEKILKKYFHQDPFKKNNYFLKRMDLVSCETRKLKKASLVSIFTSLRKENKKSKDSQFLELVLDLLKKCLVMNPRERITAEKALDHPVFSFVL